MKLSATVKETVADVQVEISEEQGAQGESWDDYAGSIMAARAVAAVSNVRDEEVVSKMAVESEAQKREFQRWSRLAIQFLGAADSGEFDHITPSVVVRELERDRVFHLLARELPASVWEISKLTDVDRHKLSHHWRMMAQAYEPKQFHVSRSGLALLAAYMLHLIDVGHATIPT